ncbi:hypothetical protein [Clostridium neonatale]|uniref:Uncharacterized protein n=1 Tax=Clostridium neonatale TaxID=137838 RepID=A0AA86JKB0_9CLOT|nr:hypothetical protein CNEO_50028 [Clostridium neonatale]
MKDNICYFDESYIFFYTDYLNDNITIEEVKFIKIKSIQILKY